MKKSTTVEKTSTAAELEKELEPATMAVVELEPATTAVIMTPAAPPPPRESSEFFFQVQFFFLSYFSYALVFQTRN